MPMLLAAPPPRDMILTVAGLHTVLTNNVSKEQFSVRIPYLGVPRGSFLTVLGGTGCGKTTALTVLGLLRRPTGPTGRPLFELHDPRRQTAPVDVVALWNRGAAAVARVRREWIGFCLQGSDLLPTLTAFENVEMPLRLNGWSAARATARARDLLVALSSDAGSRGADPELWRQRDFTPRFLSGGQKQRVALARALAHSPSLLLLDEPTASLNADIAVRALDLVRMLQGEGDTTVVMITHDHHLANEFSDFQVHLTRTQEGESANHAIGTVGSYWTRLEGGGERTWVETDEQWRPTEPARPVAALAAGGSPPAPSRAESHRAGGNRAVSRQTWSGGDTDTSDSHVALPIAEPISDASEPAKPMLAARDLEQHDALATVGVPVPERRPVLRLVFTLAAEQVAGAPAFTLDASLPAPDGAPPTQGADDTPPAPAPRPRRGTREPSDERPGTPNDERDALMSQFWYFLQTGWRDTRRSGLQLLVNAVIVVGICLPLLLLSGLKRGVVARFKAELQSSPTARQIEITALREAHKFTAAREHELERVPGVERVIPQIERLVTLDAGGTTALVTAVATRPGDAYLAFYGLDVLRPDERGVILSTAAADKLRILYDPAGEHRFAVRGEPVVALTATRALRKVKETDPDSEVSGALKLVVRGVYQANPAANVNAYVPREILARLESFVTGRPVPDWNWPAAAGQPEVQFPGYLAFTEQPYTQAERDQLHALGFGVEEVPDGPADPARTLAGLIRPREDLRLYAYRLRPGVANASVAYAPRRVEEFTSGFDDVVLAWPEPLELEVDGRPHRLVAVGGSLRWLGNLYLCHPDLQIPTGDDPMRIMFPRGGTGRSARLRLPNGKFARLTVRPTPADAVRTLGPAPPGDVPVALVPAELASYLARVRDGRLDFDPLSNCFVPRAEEPAYDKATVYARGVDDVPEVLAELERLGYQPRSPSFTRVVEVRGHVRTLDGLVGVVTAAVALSGLLTMGFVFWELTSRKSGSIAVTRILGMPSFGVFLALLVRAVSVGLAGCLLSAVLSAGAAAGLREWLGAACQPAVEDYLTLLGVALGCSLFGVIPPAWYFATRLDPVDALLASRTL